MMLGRLLQPNDPSVEIEHRGRTHSGSYSIDNSYVCVTLDSFYRRTVGIGDANPKEVISQALRDLVDEWLAKEAIEC